MTPNRRNGANTPKSSTPIELEPATRRTSISASAPNPHQGRDTTTHWTAPLLPHPLETLLLSTYPALLLFGSLFSTLSPTTRSAPYNPIAQSHPPSSAPSYFALKSNLLNTYFVKIAWFWVSLAYLLFLVVHPANGPGLLGSRGLVLTPKRLRGVLRWVVVTMWWGAVTQWFFGPAIIDRGFQLTGGACECASQYDGPGGGKEFVTGQACKAVGGRGRGGHDISGHVFILVLGSAFLGLEVLPNFMGLRDEEEG
ncbi:hypothetical protein ABVK25_009599 [Lepraria finkii]|uniref:Uncharacterized protein n=1 Tax=Lepraria finkii TaxID=1340010 RepID=A0ABR4AWV3_9LECA